MNQGPDHQDPAAFLLPTNPVSEAVLSQPLQVHFSDGLEVEGLEIPLEKWAPLECHRVLRTLEGRRRVYEGRWMGTEVVAKCFFSYPRQERHARKEWIGLTEARRRGLPIARPMVWARDGEGSLWIVMERLPNVADFRSIWLETDSLKRQIAWEALWQLLGQQHRAGVTQTDAHLGNYLWDGRNAFLCDAGGLKFYRNSLDRKTRLDHLAWVFAFGRLYWESEMWQTFPAYFCKNAEDTRSLGGAEAFTRLLVRKVKDQRVQLHRKSYAKTRRACSAWALEQIDKGVLRYHRDLPTEILEHLRRDPDHFIQEGVPLKLGNTCTLVRWQDGEGREWVVKRYNPKPLGYRLRHRFQESRAMRSWSVGLTLRDLNIRTPMPVACLECRDWSGLRSAYLVMEHVSGEPLSVYAERHRSDKPILEKIAQEIQWIWKAWERLGCVHGDMKATNFLVNSKGEVTVLDLDAFEYLVRPEGRFQRRRNKDWKRFMQNWKEIPEVAAVFREIPDTCEPPVS